MEIALSKFCGENDIITPITSSDEITRQKRGFRTAQNYINSKWYHYLNGEKISYAQTHGEFFLTIFPLLLFENWCCQGCGMTT